MPRPLYTAVYAFQTAACLFVLLACWQVQVFPFLPHYYLRCAFFPFAVLFLAWSWFARLWTIREVLCHYRWLLPWLAGVLLMQAVTAWLRSPEPGVWAIPAVFSVTGKVAVQMLCMAVLLQVCRVFVQHREVYPFLLRGAGFAFIVIVCACAIQAFHIVFAHTRQPWAQFLAEYSAVLLQSVPSWLEARWPEIIYDFYRNGTYTLTTFRINGIYEEASALAANVGVFFFPLGFGLCFLTGKAQKSGRIIVALSLLILAGATSFTGLALFATGLGVLGGYFFLKQRTHRRSLFCIVLLLHATAALVFFSTDMRQRWNQYSSLSLPRAVITLDALDLVKEYPWLGIGRSNFSRYIVGQKRYVERSAHDPELRSWEKAGSVPELSALPAFAAEYGIPVTLLCGILLAGVWRRLYQLRRSEKAGDFHTFVLAAYSAWLALAFVAGCASVGLRNPMFCLPFFFAAAAASDISGVHKE